MSSEVDIIKQVKADSREIQIKHATLKSKYFRLEFIDMNSSVESDIDKLNCY